MKYEPFDALYWFTQLGAERSAMLIHQASFATTQMGQYKAPDLRNIGKTPGDFFSVVGFTSDLICASRLSHVRITSRYQ